MPSFKKIGGKKTQTPKKTRSNNRKKAKKVSKSGTKKLGWFQACKKMGYMKKGADFKPIPKAGTPEYMKIKALMA